MPVTTPAPYRLGSATRTSSTRFAIPSLRRTGSRTSGANQAEKRDVEKGWELVELHGFASAATAAMQSARVPCMPPAPDMASRASLLQLPAWGARH
jgi:hypothetical protein